MKQLLSVGCSNTLGVDLEEEIDLTNSSNKFEDIRAYREKNNFSTLVAEYFNLECINLGKSGASNERIIITTVDYIENNPKPELVLVNLSASSRITLEIGGRLVDIDLTYPNTLLKQSTGIEEKDFIPFLNFYKRNCVTDYNLIVKQKNLYRYISLYLEKLDIPFLISETIPTDLNLKEFTNKCLDVNFDDFNTSQGRRRAKGNHWLSDSHKEWAKLIINKIEQNDSI